MRYSRLLVALLALLILSSCLPALPNQELPLTATLAPPAIPSTTSLPTETALPQPSDTPIPIATSIPRPARVLVISIDGFRPETIAIAPMPNLQALMQTGAYSLTAQTVYPSATLPAHASMFTSMCPSKHLVDWNDYIPENGYAQGTDLFDLAQAAGLKTMMLVSKEKVQQITEPQSIDVFEYLNDRDTVVAQKAAEMIPQGFDLFFIHFRTPDGMGHEYGWLSPEYLSVSFRADEALQTILDALERAGMRNDTLIIITSDHGGHDTTHGSSLPEDMTIPWIIAGPGVVPARLMTDVNVVDTAATAAWALDLPLSAEWDGLPVLEAFGLPDKVHVNPRCEWP